jgi:hypothetical protein
MAFEMEAAEQTRRLQQEQKSAAELEFRQLRQAWCFGFAAFAVVDDDGPDVAF